MLTGDRRLDVRWALPATTARTTGFRVLLTSPGRPARTLTVAPGARRLVVTGLTRGVAYGVQVQARARGGDSPYSATVRATTPRAPTAPRSLTARGGAPGGAATIDVRWAVPGSSGGAPVTGYVLRLQRAGSRPVLSVGAGAADRRAIVSRGLVAGARYVVTVVARNAAGPGAAASVRVVAR